MSPPEGDWRKSRLARLGHFVPGCAFPHEYQGVEDAEIPFFKVGDMARPENNREMVRWNNSVSLEVARTLGARVCPSRTIVFAKVGAALLGNKRRLLTRPAAFDNNMMGFIPVSAHPEFLLYSLLRIDFGKWANPGPVPSLNETDLREVEVLLPPLDRQRAIADFLDRKTAAVDALIAKKERLIELLTEKRQTVLTRAVTRGLEPHGRTSPTGVPWFAHRPSRWTVTKLKYISSEVTVGIVVTPAKYYVEEGVPALRSFNIRAGNISDADLAYISPDANEMHSKSKLAEGDLVAVRTGQPGTTAMVDRRFDGANCVDLILVRRSQRFRAPFVCYFMNSGPAHQQYGEGSEGALQQHFNVETAKNLVLPLPPVEEQDAIIAWLDHELGRLDATMHAIERHLSALREYRQALITAAVTGQLDVAAQVAA